MRRVGEVVRVAQGVAVVRCPAGGETTDGTGDVPPIGTDVIDESLAVVGRVVDVFGPVDRPYLAVTPADEDSAAGEGSPAELLGRVVYVR